ncbi:MAG: hypothetical protein R2810_04925 [Flavobacteriales bacterium]
MPTPSTALQARSATWEFLSLVRLVAIMALAVALMLGLTCRWPGSVN